MKLIRILLPLILTLGFIASASAQPNATRMDLRDMGERKRNVERLREIRQRERNQAYALAQRKGWRTRSTRQGNSYELIAYRHGRPIYLAPCNENVAISTAADRVRIVPPFSLTGTGVRVGLWDQGIVRATHQEFGNRVAVRDGGAEQDEHTTHLAGTIGALGVVATAQGMAPDVYIDSYDWYQDDVEMAAVAAATANQGGFVSLSNHSYGFLAGWVFDTDFSGNSGPHWFGDLDLGEDPLFGQYDYTSSVWDALCYGAPYFLPIKASGGQRDDNAPAPGTVYYYFDADQGDWTSATYATETGPPSDGWKDGGYDTLTDTACAKNLLTVGVVEQATPGGQRTPSSARVMEFSGWGPCDDGRIKPDLVAGGSAVYSCAIASDSAYSSRTGTSMATAGVCGTAALLTEYYKRGSLGLLMPASALKALLIHTADDIAAPGPDYTSGWGLINAQTAAEHIRCHQTNPNAHSIVFGALNAGRPSEAFSFTWGGAETAIRATLCWTDPAGEERYDLNDPTPVLVNDLDLRISAASGAPVFFPYVLDPVHPTATATRGDNKVDNVEQVLIENPVPGTTYMLTVSHKGSLSGGVQAYSLLLSGQVPLVAAEASDWWRY